jgi:hypothetical protein
MVAGAAFAACMPLLVRLDCGVVGSLQRDGSRLGRVDRDGCVGQRVRRLVRGQQASGLDPVTYERALNCQSSRDLPPTEDGANISGQPPFFMQWPA